VFFRNVTFAAKVPDEEMQDFYRACDAFLFPNENQMWVQSVLEAMARGCPAETSSASFSEKAIKYGQSSRTESPRYGKIQ
jgi:glycosyltransferase involved in cell wall biosynthesis